MSAREGGRPVTATYDLAASPGWARDSKATGCSLPSRFSRISTLPSASSSSLRQEPDNFMPSSKSSSARSRETSPFSSSATMVSRRWRDSSNLAKRKLPYQFYSQLQESDDQEFEKFKATRPIIC